MGKKSKSKRAEKTKTKLKKTGPGLHLPKGTNVTKAEVKVAKIGIPKQFSGAAAAKGVKDGDAAAVTRKNLSLADLLAKLAHFSSSVKAQSLEGLKELLTGDYADELVHQNLSLLISRIIPLCGDIEQRIRKHSLSILQSILTKVDNNLLEPQYPLITAHLSSFLTNIQPQIQRDALPLVDTLTLSAPNFIAANYGRILPDCIRQIASDDQTSSGKAQSAPKSAPKSGGRSSGVSSKVADNISALEWRINVLSRVNKILNCLCKKSKNQEEENHGAVSTIEFKENMNICLIPSGNINHIAKLELLQKSTKDPMIDLVKKIIPLAIDSWIEATNSKDNGNRHSFLANDVHSLLTSISGILYNFVQYAETFNNSEILILIRKQYFKELNAKLFSHLPYSSNNGRCNKENLQLCSVILRGSPALTTELVDKITNILRQTINNEGSNDLIVYKEMLEHARIDEARKIEIGKLLIEKSQIYKTGTKEWTLCFSILGRLAESDSSLDDWVDTLPQVLTTTRTKFESNIVMQIMLTLAKQRNPTFVQSYARDQHAVRDWLKSLEEKDDESVRLISFIQQNVIIPQYA